jgi:hypothetical protein
MSKSNPQIAEFMRGVKVAADRVEAAISNLDDALLSGAESNGHWHAYADVSTILEIADYDIQSAIEDFLRDAETLPATEADEITKVAA